MYIVHTYVCMIAEVQCSGNDTVQPRMIRQIDKDLYKTTLTNNVK